MFGVTGIESGEWIIIGMTDVDDSIFPLPPMTTGHIAKKGPHEGLLEIDIYGPDNLVGPTDVRWVDPNMAGVDRLPTSGVEGAVYIERRSLLGNSRNWRRRWKSGSEPNGPDPVGGVQCFIPGACQMVCVSGEVQP